jgi:uncharacterized protein
MHYLNETYETQKQIEEFAEDIKSVASSLISSFIRQGKHLEDLPVIPYRRFSPLSKYGELGEYIRNSGGEGIYIADLRRLSKKPGKIELGSFSRKTGNITLGFPIDDVHLKGPDKWSAGSIEMFFEDTKIAGYSAISALVHELQHALDEWQSRGRAYKTKEALAYDELKNPSYERYLKLPHEISARFSQSMKDMDFLQGGKIVPLRFFIEDFQRKFEGWEDMKPSVKKSLIRRASAFWHKKQDELENNESYMNRTEIIPLEEYLKLNEDFQNPFADDETNKKGPEHIADKGGLFQQRKETFNLSRVEWSKRPGGDYTVVARTQFARGEIIEICPLIILPEITKTVDRLKDIVFEIDKKKGEYGLVLGYGSLYKHSNKANVDYSYNKRQRHMFFVANRPIQLNEELTIDYGSDYWEERSNLNTMAEIENITQTKSQDKQMPEIEESQIQPNAADIQGNKSRGEFAEPNSRANPVVSGVAIRGLGQQ